MHCVFGALNENDCVATFGQFDGAEVIPRIKRVCDFAVAATYMHDETVRHDGNEAVVEEQQRDPAESDDESSRHQDGADHAHGMTAGELLERSRVEHQRRSEGQEDDRGDEKAARRSGLVDAEELQVLARRDGHPSTLVAVDERVAPQRSYLTWVLIALNVAVFVGQLVMARSFEGQHEDMPREVVMAFGGNYAASTLREGRVETLVASCFVHFSFLHIAFNMVALYQVMPFLERTVGVGRAATLYLASGVVGSMFSALYGWVVEGQRLGAGASGAICGLIGGALVVGWRIQGAGSPLMRGMARWLAAVLIIGALAHFDNAAHAGGAIAGALVALAWRRGPELPAGRAANVALFTIVLLATAGRVVQQDVTNPFATMTADERLAAAGRALDAGRCQEARDAMAAARRVAPHARAVLDDAQIVRRICGGDR